MPDNAGSLERIAIELANALTPIRARLSAPHLPETLAELGVGFPGPVPSAVVTAANKASTGADGVATSLQSLAAAITSGNEAQIVVKGLDLIGRFAKVIEGFASMRTAINSAGVSVPANFADRIFDFFVVADLDALPVAGNLLALAGIIERTEHPGTPGDPTDPQFTTQHIHWDRIFKLIRDPKGHLTQIYGWGSGGFNGNLLLPALHDFIARQGLPTVLHPANGPNPMRLEAFAFDLTPDTTTNPPSLKIDVVFPVGGTIDRTFQLPHPAWSAKFKVDGQASAKTGGRITPPASIELKPPAGDLNATVSLTVVGNPASPFILFGKAGKSRLEVAGIEAGLGINVKWNSGTNKAQAEPLVNGAIKGGKVIIDNSEGDGFIATLLSGVKAEAEFNLGFAWSASDGVRFDGSGSLVLELPVHISLGPIEISRIYLSVGLEKTVVPLELSAAISAQLGPLMASVDRLGVLANLSFPNNGGNLGPAQFDIAFKPPNGVGLAVDAGVIVGGGYLFLDPDRGEYAGALELTFSGFLALKAIGLITTKMPDGSSGFSLLIIITAEFGTGIQLGFGFTLLAVGGLLGLNRTMKMQELMDGVRTGAIESIMFPQNVVANAPKIISDLRAIFPPQQDRFLIGPMAKLGWGTPTLISISLGIIIEIPPGNIAILGVLKVVIPADEIALIVLQVNFAGAIEFDKKRIYFFAALFESRVVFITLEGEMGLLVAFGDDANFVVSVGGFHPRFTPPPLPFPSPKRISISILNTPIARVGVQGYFAVTSNTVQFGARVDVFFGFDILNVQGHLGFDALFQFQPFFFIIEISASFSVKVFGAGLFSVSVSGTLKGPEPWHVKGHGSISILFWDIDVDIEKTWGESRNTNLPPVTVMDKFVAELNKPDNWTALLPKSNKLSVSLRKMPAEEVAMVLHPLGSLHISQRALPLELKLEKVGNQQPSDVNRLSVTVTGGGLAKVKDAFEQFAPAQFQKLSDSEKLSRPAFAPEKSGLDLSASGQDMRSSVMVKRIVRYEEIIIDSNFKRFQRRFRGFMGSLFQFFLNGNASARCEVSAATKVKLVPFEEKIKVVTETYTVAFQSNNKAFTTEATFHSEASARDFMNTKVAEDASLAEEIHVIPTFELAA